MGRILENFSNVLRVLIGVLMAILFIPVFMQVVARLGVIPVYLWTEELSTFIFVWVVMLGAMLAVWDSTHFDVRVIPDAENPLLKLIQVGFVHLLIFVFALMFILYGIDYAKLGSIQNSTMMRANMLITFITVPIAGVVWALFSGYRLYECFVEYRASRKATS